MYHLDYIQYKYRGVPMAYFLHSYLHIYRRKKMIQFNKKMQRRIIETALISSLVAMTGTGFSGMKKTHMASSIVFMSFSLYHYLLYRPFHKKFFKTVLSVWNKRSPVVKQQ